MQAFSSAEHIQELAVLSEKIFSCTDIAEIGRIVVNEVSKFIQTNEIIVDVNSFDLRRQGDCGSS
ncbi:MAG: hypothetical protein NT027_16400 [Proteobacteria bacterium]|nr:hypothetical protein [Pseudomonadota bacterium]